MLHIKSGIFCKFRVVLGIILVFGIYSPLASAVISPEFELLKSFGKQEGNPTGRLVQDANGNIYGTTQFGGNKGGLGTIFKISASGTYSNLHSFDGFDGMTPTVLIQGFDGKLYGITEGGGNGFSAHALWGGYGTVFQLDISRETPVYTVLHKFDSTNGVLPTGVVQGSNGKLYGTTSGDHGNTGTVFQLDISATTPVYSVLHTFPLASGPQNYGGARNLIQGSDGKLYGQAIVSMDRTVSSYFFSLDLSGTASAYTVLYEFVDFPYSLIQGRDGKFYGTGVNTLFQLDISGAIPTYTVLYNGGGNAGIFGHLIQGSDSKLYGTTSLEGIDNVDTVFQLDIFGKTPTYTVLHAFDGVKVGALGGYLIQGNDNKLYGAATSGNDSPFKDIVFQLDIAGKPAIYNVLHKFNSNSTEIRPTGVIQGSDGNFYGNTEYGGNYDAGTVFKLDTSQDLPIYNVLHAFNLNPNLAKDGGGLPGTAPLVQGRDGNLYGTTIGGGSADKGTVFQVDISRTTPAYRVLHEFDKNTVGSGAGGLIQGSDGKFYGETAGTIFKIDTSGTTPVYTLLHVFDTPNNNSGISANLFQSSDGKFYGTANYGGGSGVGTVFQLDTSGAVPVYNVLYEFDVLHGSYPTGSLIQGSNGKLYGTTHFGGSFDRGTVFQLDISGRAPIYTVLHEFDGISDGTTSGLTQGSDGNLYGTTDNGGGYYAGTVFQLDISGVIPIFTVLHEFTGTSNDGMQASGKIIQASDGNFYGTTAYGGNFGGGVIYRLRMPPSNTPPVAVSDSFALHIPKQKAPVTVAVPGVLGNDKDAEGNPLTVVGIMGTTPKVIEFPREGGKVALYADGHFVYTPAKEGFYGAHSFTYQATDGQAASNTATVTLTIIPPRHEGHGHDNKHRKNGHH